MGFSTHLGGGSGEWPPGEAKDLWDPGSRIPASPGDRAPAGDPEREPAGSPLPRAKPPGLTAKS